MPLSRNCVLALEVPINSLFKYTCSTEKRCVNTQCHKQEEQSVEEYQYCYYCGLRKSLVVSEWYTNIKTGDTFTAKQNIKVAGYEVYTDLENYPDSLFVRFNCLYSELSSISIDFNKLIEFRAKLMKDEIWELGTFGMFEELC